MARASCTQRKIIVGRIIFISHFAFMTGHWLTHLEHERHPPHH